MRHFILQVWKKKLIAKPKHLPKKKIRYFQHIPVLTKLGEQWHLYQSCVSF